MEYTARDLMIHDVVNRMTGMSDGEISDYLGKCKGVYVDPNWIGMYRPSANQEDAQ